MPTYQYACTACSHQLEAVQSFTDDPLTDCPQCQGRLRKVFNSVGIVFKGSGFYRTDSRAASNGSSGSNGRADGAGKSGASESGKSDSGATAKSADSGTSSGKTTSKASTTSS